jgi:hypothetical protein
MDTGVWMVMAALLAQAPGPAERVAAPPVDGVPVSVDVRSDIGRRFRLKEAVLSIDGKEVARQTAPRGDELARSFRLWPSQQASYAAGLLRPGDHVLAVRFSYDGRALGPFEYLDQYDIRTEARVAFAVSGDGRPAALEVVARERPSSRAPLPAEPVLSVDPRPGSAAVAVPLPVQRR